MNPTQMNREPQELPGADEAAAVSGGLPTGGLSAALLRTEDLADLINGFAAEARAFVPVAGVRYSNAEHGIDIRTGALERHSCRYTLRMRALTLGQITFTRARRFGGGELMTLELLLVELLLPLLAALRRRALAAFGGAEPRAADGVRRPAVAPREAEGLSLVPLGEAEPGPTLLRHVRPRVDRVQVDADRRSHLRPEELADPLLHWGAFGLEPSRGEKG
jgi:hypothetical protein